ncbi:cytochrome c biogenesis protein transmembrane region [Ferroglobus placidus DSM 10642]|uniref:Cytochrome c biogenesis protein transmembrane region n=1 Tax=Ferroglobus placidus (strain DSM 10642 / AEDII12DO) TaxID=589924 RepID=D3S261_FERPA|nr:cytochrome c biogenesis protein CcdA [Ferroglobus placidus]ADC66552.1 cytochrome c biogenesis protein transmembrane region [Ferroglobus placidus DSM 10642]
MIEFALAFLAGVVSVISPCVLPLIPVIFSASRFSWKEVFLIVFTMVATFVILGYFAGIFSNYLLTRVVASALLLLFGVILLENKVYEKYVILVSRISGKFSNVTSPLLLGFSLGLVWSPCIGPFVGALLSYAALSGSEKGASIMLSFGIGLALTLSFVALFSEKISYGKIARYEDKIRKAAGIIVVLYAFLFAFGIYSKIVALLARLIPL